MLVACLRFHLNIKLSHVVAALSFRTYNDLNTAQKVGNYKLFKTVPSNQAISTWKKEIEVKVYEKSLTKWALIVWCGIELSHALLTECFYQKM